MYTADTVLSYNAKCVAGDERKSVTENGYCIRIVLDTFDICRPGHVITMSTDALAPNRRQTIRNNHADSIMTTLSNESCCLTLISCTVIKPTKRGWAVGNS